MDFTHESVARCCRLGLCGDLSIDVSTVQTSQQFQWDASVYVHGTTA